MGDESRNESKGVGAADASAVRGRADVECRVVVRARCPYCGRVHRHVVGAADWPSLSLPGAHLFRQDCGDVRYLVQVPERAFARALARARAIAARHHLSDAWLGGAREAAQGEAAQGEAADSRGVWYGDGVPRGQ